ncbi:MAG: GTPase HflX [Syntrophomonadaceae bacterium]|nr:GTPase HflX [Syntrophomonadaceae bacterium]
MFTKCLLFGIINDDNTDDEFRELKTLVESSGNYEVLGVVTQRRPQPEPRFYLGKGKLEALRNLVRELSAELVVCDDELTPSQQRNIAGYLDTAVTDRTGIILDIFAQRAHTAEGKIQVELARLRYQLPRLSGRGTELSRLGGGIGTRGPGETKLETDRRKVRRRIKELEMELDNITRHRVVTRRWRKQREVPMVSLVGYTNAGKSTIMGALTGGERVGDPRLFATLETTGRRVDLPGGGYFVLSDTVGFINKLPHQLVASFRATLMEVKEADLLLHVVDVSTPGIEKRMSTVEQVVAEIDDRPRLELKVYNKIDLLSPAEADRLRMLLPDGIMVSAVTGQGMSELLARIQQLLFAEAMEITLNIPYSRGDLVNLLYDNCRVLQCENMPSGIRMQVRGSRNILERVFQALNGEERYE